MLMIEDKKNNRLEKNKKLSFLNKLKICLMILSSSRFKPVLKIDDNVELDLSNNKIIITKPFHIHCLEDLTISSSKNIIIDSGKKKDPERPGYFYSIWLNSPKDLKGKPLKSGDQ